MTNRSMLLKHTKAMFVIKKPSSASLCVRSCRRENTESIKPSLVKDERVNRVNMQSV